MTVSLVRVKKDLFTNVSIWRARAGVARHSPSAAALKSVVCDACLTGCSSSIRHRSRSRSSQRARCKRLRTVPTGTFRMAPISSYRRPSKSFRMTTARCSGPSWSGRLRRSARARPAREGRWGRHRLIRPPALHTGRLRGRHCARRRPVAAPSPMPAEGARLTPIR